MKTIFTKTLAVSLFLGAAGLLHAQTAEQRQKIASSYDQQKLTELRNRFAQEQKQNKEAALQKARENNWPVTIKGEDGSFSELMGLNPDGSPLYYKTSNSGSAVTINTRAVNTNGGMGLNLNGNNMVVGVWDGGPTRLTHQEFGNRGVQKDNVPFTEPTGGSDHATHVSGTIAAAGINSLARGMAYQSQLWANDWAFDITEMVAQAGEGLLVSNHSYGMNLDFASLWHFGAYNSSSAAFDAVMHAAPSYQIVTAAGNERHLFQTYNPTKAGRDMLVGTSTAKNAIVVAAISQVSNYTGMSSVVVSNFSNWGPTDDGRVKPDISAKGVGVFSTLSTGNSDYGPNNGTSMAAPAVAGSLILLQEHYNNLNGNFMRSATLRALMAHSAREAGQGHAFAGPDHKYGWGLMNTGAAAQIITENGTFSHIDERTLNQGQVYTRTVISDGVNPLIATIAWTDPVGPQNPGIVDWATPALVNNLDLKLTRDGVTYYPWRLNTGFIQGGALKNGDNNVDNIEKVEITVPEAGVYELTVSHKGNLSGGSQQYSLVVSGINEEMSTDRFTASSFMVSPNPTNGVLGIAIKDGAAADTQVEVFDMLGKRVENRRFLAVESADMQLDITHLPASVYMVRLTQGNVVETIKIIKK